MPVFGMELESLEPHVCYFERKCMAKGATQRKAREWAWRMGRKGKRMPPEGFVPARGSDG